MSGPQDNLPPVAASPENTAPTRRRDRTRPPRSTGPSNDALPRLTNRWAPLDIFTTEQLERILDGAFRVLAEAGLEIRSAGARAIFARHGAIVDDATQMVRIGRDIVESCLDSAPETFVLHARNAARDLHVGGNVVNFGPVNGAPHITDLEKGPPLRRHRRLPRYPEGHPSPRRAALAGRRGGGAGRPARAEQAPRHVPRPYRVLGYRLGRARRRRTPGARRHRHVGHRAWNEHRGAGGSPDADDRHQRQLPAPAGRGNPRQHHDHGRDTASAW